MLKLWTKFVLNRSKFKAVQKEGRKEGRKDSIKTILPSEVQFSGVYNKVSTECLLIILIQRGYRLCGI